MSKKILAMLMAVAMAFSLLPVTALAGNPSLLSITPPNDGKFATYEFYKIKDDTSSLWYTQTVKTGDTLKPPADPTRTGYYFTGWKTANGTPVSFGPVTVEKTSTIQCYAQWEKNANPIHVYFMAAEKAAENSNEVVYTGVAQDGAVTIPADYQDITWKTADGKDFDGKNITEDMNVYPASASCWLTFDSQGGSAIASHYVPQGNAFDLKDVGNPTKAGYTFAGWSLKVNGTKQTEVIPNGDTKLYALWTPTTADYTVIHWQENANDDGYSFKESQKLSGKTDGRTNAVANSYEGFTEQAIEQQTIKGDGSTIVNVFYKRNVYEVKFILDEPTYTCGKEEHKHQGFYGLGGCYDIHGNLKCGKEAHTHDNSCGKTSEIVISAKYGAYIGDQWPTIDGSSTWKISRTKFQANIQTMPLGGAKYYGPKTGKTFESAQYYVEVLPGEAGEDGTVTQGDVTYKLHHTDTTPTTPGSKLKVTEEDKYPLTGFTYKEGTENKANYNNAKFYYTRNSYNVVYVSNGDVVHQESYRYEQDISGAGNYPPTNTPTGYTFGGWYSNPSEATPYNFSGKTMPAQNITVYAKWVPITLTLTIEGVEGVTNGTVNYNQVINGAGVYKQATDKLTAANKTVLYWVTSTGDRVDVSSQMTKNLTIRPVLKGDTYTVTYDSGATDSQKYWFNTIAKVKNYTGEKANKFLYWTDAANTTTKYHPGDQIRMTANVTLKPKFSEETPGQTYSVTYHSNFGTGQEYTPTESIKNNDLFTIKAYEDTKLPNREDYEFKEWNTKSDGTGKTFEAGSSARMNGANDNDLYAQWQPCTYTLTYDANGGQFGSGDSALTTKQESDIRAGDYPLKYTGDYTPTHAKSEGKNVVFLGWSETDDSEKIYDKGDTIPNLIQSVTINGNKTVHAVWGYDAIGKDNKPDGVPDVFNAVVTYNIVGGTWDGINNSATEVIKVKTFDKTTKIWTNTDAKLSSIPNINEVKPDENHTLSGSWGDPDSTPTENTVVTADKMYTYTLSPVTTGTLTITKKVVGDELTVDSLPENFQITVKDAQGETKGTLIKTEEAKKADGTLTWTIFDLPAGEYTVSEENAGVDGYDCTAAYASSNETDTEKSVTVTENQTSTMTVTNKYTKQEVVPPTPADPVKLDVSRSKTAKPLDTSTWTSNVTLSLPSAEYEPVIDVVFILDDTYAGNGIFKDAATALLNELSEKKNLDVNVGIVNFDAVARDWVAATTNSQYSGLVSLKNTEGLTALQSAIDTKLDKNNDGQTKKIGATNIEWPLEMAQNMLASGKGTEKYAILFSDMYGYVYRGDLIIDGQAYENVPLSKRLYAGESKFYQGSLSMGTKYQSFADVYAHRNDQENQTIDGFFRDTSWDDYWNIYSGYTQAPTNPVTKGSEDPFGVSGGYSGFEKSTCLVYDRLLQMKQAGINISIVNNDFAPGTVDEVGYIHSIKNEMLNVLKEKGISVIQTQKDVTAGDMTNVFDTLKDQLIQVVSAGSTVTDKIGTNFDFVGLNTMSLKIGDDTIPGVIDEATNTITFKHADKNDAHVVAYDSDTNSFKWTINEDVTKDARVQLTYTVKLKTPQTLAGTYGVEDLNGDGKVDRTDTTYTDTDALYTNESATMVPKDSNGNTGEELTFPKPSVSYTVKSSSGSHSGGSRPSLNTKDHYGYIIGYPVDYYTGQPTTDQTKKPVRPEGKITRAEVATIYFRMLTDESRTKFWSQNSGYSDVKTGDWFNNAVSTLSNAGIIAGYEDGSFRPNGYITRAEFATIAARFFDVTYNGKDLFPDISGHWAKDYINQAANKGFVNGYEDGTFKPDRNITRAEAVTLVNRTLDRHPDKSHFTKDMLVWPDNMDQTKWYYADMQEATNSHTYQMKENSDKTKYENWTKTLPIRNWEALEKAWSNANSSQGNGNVV